MTQERLQLLSELLEEFINSPVKELSKVRAGQTKIDVCLAASHGVENPLKTYNVISEHDGNDEFNVDAKSFDDACHEALNELGWRVTESK